MRFLMPLIIIGALLASQIAWAQSGPGLDFTPVNRFTDVRMTSPEAAGISLLARENIVHGYSGNFFGTSRLINRAELLKIALLSAGTTGDLTARTCFQDVLAADWFSSYVCAAKDRGIVNGRTPELFWPGDTVSYGEALAILTRTYGYTIPAVSGRDWAEPYYLAAEASGVDIPVTISLDSPLTRGLAARLVGAFLAESKGELALFRLAESGQYPSSSSSSVSSASSSSQASTSSSSSSSSVGQVDQLPDTEARSQFLLLGEVGPVLGAAKVFIYEEALNVSSISINVNSEVRSINDLLIYDENRHLVGRAKLDPTTSTNRSYKLTLAAGILTIPRQQEVSFYARPSMISKDMGGVSNEVIQISNFVFRGTGGWSNQSYTKASTETFPAFLTARGEITKISNVLQATDALVSGQDRKLAAFTMEGRTTDSTAQVMVSQLTFDVSITGNVQLSNVNLRADGTNDRQSCTSNLTQIICQVPATFGELKDGPRTLSVYGDISQVGSDHASLRLTLNEPGNVLTAGAVTWTDGTSTFNFVALDSPLADGTLWKF